ncbi:cytochrome P450 [Archangium violaceum]|uniref:cytochrome P450 n=1 Tax=Archangium violaceum TaxID=83451 RepID=UPI0019528F1B|nr:cytochrome P450 [Archangium violaceum]QRO00846.1 cytochrome P450 [Archangium violaceum]
MTNPINLMAPEVLANPYPYYAELRRLSPVCQVEPHGMWAVSRYEDVLFVLKNSALFSSSGFTVAWQPAWVGYNPMANSMITRDPPQHTRLRSLVLRAFGPATIARLESRVRATAEKLSSGLVDGADFVKTMALPVPAYVISEILGLDHQLLPYFKQWSDDIVAITPTPASPEAAERIRGTIAKLTGYVGQVIEERRREPADDTVSELLRAEVEGQRLTDVEIKDFLILLLVAGLESTTNLLGNSLLFLANHPEMMARLRAEPSLIPLFIEEMLRYDGVAPGVPRIAASDIILSGVTVPRGAMVFPLISSANRDEQKFPDPDRFDLHRGSQGGLAFGQGAHFCLGALLARMEVRIVLETVVARFQRVERTAGEISYQCALTTRGPVALPLRYIPASG